MNVTGIVLAGGSSSRLGVNKALLKIDGQPLVARVISRLRSLVDQVVLITNTPEQFSFLKIPQFPDQYRQIGALGGLHAGLSAIKSEYGLVVGCDMPLLNVELLRFMLSQRAGYDVVMPRVNDYYEPLHAIYARRCLPAIEQTIQSGRRRVLHACAQMRVRYILEPEISHHDPQHLSFFNINTPQDLERLQKLLTDAN